MDSGRIKQLLEKYWACESTLQEEEELKQLLAQSNDDQYINEKALFSYYSNTKKINLDSEKAEQFVESLENDDVDHSDTQVVTMKKPSVQWWQIAAVISGIAVASIIFKDYVVPSNDGTDTVVATVQMDDTYDDPEVALEETKKALAFIASKLNSGKKQVQKIKAFNEAEEKIKESKTEK